MAGSFQEKVARFMYGRYGYDEKNKHLAYVAIALIIASLVLSVLSRWLGNWVYYLSQLITWASFALVIYILFRAFSRNIPARRAENDRYLEKKRKRESKRAKTTSDAEPEDVVYDGEFVLLTCQACNQKMRVPRGKGTILVECPKCKEKTKITS